MAPLVPDQPELLALASLAAVPASKMAAAFSEPERFFEHLSLEELARVQAACERLGVMVGQFIEAVEVATEQARAVLTEAL